MLSEDASVESVELGVAASSVDSLEVCPAISGGTNSVSSYAGVVVSYDVEDSSGVVEGYVSVEVSVDEEVSSGAAGSESSY